MASIKQMSNGFKKFSINPIINKTNTPFYDETLANYRQICDSIDCDNMYANKNDFICKNKRASLELFSINKTKFLKKAQSLLENSGINNLFEVIPEKSVRHFRTDFDFKDKNKNEIPHCYNDLTNIAKKIISFVKISFTEYDYKTIEYSVLISHDKNHLVTINGTKNTFFIDRIHDVTNPIYPEKLDIYKKFITSAHIIFSIKLRNHTDERAFAQLFNKTYPIQYFDMCIYNSNALFRMPLMNKEATMDYSTKKEKTPASNKKLYPVEVINDCLWVRNKLINIDFVTIVNTPISNIKHKLNNDIHYDCIKIPNHILDKTTNATTYVNKLAPNLKYNIDYTINETRRISNELLGVLMLTPEKLIDSYFWKQLCQTIINVLLVSKICKNATEILKHTIMVQFLLTSQLDKYAEAEYIEKNIEYVKNHAVYKETTFNKSHPYFKPLANIYLCYINKCLHELNKCVSNCYLCDINSCINDDYECCIDVNCPRNHIKLNLSFTSETIENKQYLKIAGTNHYWDVNEFVFLADCKIITNKDGDKKILCNNQFSFMIDVIINQKQTFQEKQKELCITSYTELIQFKEMESWCKTKEELALPENNKYVILNKHKELQFSNLTKNEAFKCNTGSGKTKDILQNHITNFLLLPKIKNKENKIVSQTALSITDNISMSRACCKNVLDWLKNANEIIVAKNEKLTEINKRLIETNKTSLTPKNLYRMKDCIKENQILFYIDEKKTLTGDQVLIYFDELNGTKTNHISKFKKKKNAKKQKEVEEDDETPIIIDEGTPEVIEDNIILVICCYNSLMKYKHYKPDIIFIDEYKNVTKVVDNALGMNNEAKKDLLDVFLNFIRKAKVVKVYDAMIDPYMIEILTTNLKHKQLTIFELIDFIPINKNVRIVSQDRAIQMMIDDVKNDKKIAVHSPYYTSLTNLMKKINMNCPNKRIFLTSKRGTFDSAPTNNLFQNEEEFYKEFIRDTSIWEHAVAILMSPKIVTGISQNSKKVFNRVFLCVGNLSVDSDQLFQMACRVRDTIQCEIIMYFSQNQKTTLYKLSNIVDNSTRTTENYINFISNLWCETNNNNKKMPYISINDTEPFDIENGKYFTKTINTIPSQLKDITDYKDKQYYWFMNISKQNKTFDFKNMNAMVLKHFCDGGYTIKYDFVENYTPDVVEQSNSIEPNIELVIATEVIETHPIISLAEPDVYPYEGLFSEYILSLVDEIKAHFKQSIIELTPAPHIDILSHDRLKFLLSDILTTQEYENCIYNQRKIGCVSHDGSPLSNKCWKIEQLHKYNFSSEFYIINKEVMDNIFVWLKSTEYYKVRNVQLYPHKKSLEFILNNIFVRMPDFVVMKKEKKYQEERMTFLKKMFCCVVVFKIFDELNLTFTDIKQFFNVYVNKYFLIPKDTFMHKFVTIFKKYEDVFNYLKISSNGIIEKREYKKICLFYEMVFSYFGLTIQFNKETKNSSIDDFINIGYYNNTKKGLKPIVFQEFDGLLDEIKDCLDPVDFVSIGTYGIYGAYPRVMKMDIDYFNNSIGKKLEIFMTSVNIQSLEAIIENNNFTNHNNNNCSEETDEGHNETTECNNIVTNTEDHETIIIDQINAIKQLFSYNTEFIKIIDETENNYKKIDLLNSFAEYHKNKSKVPIYNFTTSAKLMSCEPEPEPENSEEPSDEPVEIASVLIEITPEPVVIDETTLMFFYETVVNPAIGDRTIKIFCNKCNKDFVKRDYKKHFDTKKHQSCLHKPVDILI